MREYLLVTIVCMLPALSLFGQSGLSVEKQMSTVKENKVGSRSVVLPNTLSDRLTKLQVAKGNKKNYNFQTAQLKKIFQKINLLRVAEYFDVQTKIIKNRDGTFTAIGGMRSHPAFYPAILYKEKIYLFTESNAETDTEIFNLFLKEANLKIENEKEAAELANLYFSITRGYFENKGKLILSDVEDIPLSYRDRKEAETERLQKVITEPKTKLVGDSYEVELYTWEIFHGEVKKWSFKIRLDAQIEVQSEIIGKL